MSPEQNPELSFEYVDVVKADRFIDPLAADVILNPDQVPLEFYSGFSNFYRSSSYHGRSFEDRNGLVFSDARLVDESGDAYPAISIKGAITSKRSMRYSSVEPNQVQVNGMLDSETFTRVQEISRHLRKEGVLTEWPFYHARPKQFPIKIRNSEGKREVQCLSFSKIRNQMVESYADTFIGEDISAVEARQRTSVGQYGAALQGLPEFKPGVMYRGMMSNIRLAELEVFYKAELLGPAVETAIAALKLRRPDHLWSWSDIEKLDPADPGDQAKYLSSVLPSIMGENLARLHSAGACHRYPHMGNWTLAGEIVDLDSVICGSLYEDDVRSVTMAERICDVAKTLNHFTDWDIASSLSIDEEHFYKELIKMYYSERNMAEGLSEVERVVVDVLFSPPEDEIADTPEPAILHFSSAESQEIMKQLFTVCLLRGQKTDEELVDFIEQWMDDRVQTFMPQVKQYFSNEDLSQMPSFFNLELVAYVEIKRLYAKYQKVLDAILAKFEGDTDLTRALQSII